MTNSRPLHPWLFALCMACVTGCKDSNTSSPEFENSLTFGTGLAGSGFDLSDEGTSFSLATTNGTLWFRLESADDMGGRAVRLYINGGTYATDDFPNPQSYGHLLLSSTRITDSGAFTIKGYLVAQVGPDIGKETFIAESTLNMRQ